LLTPPNIDLDTGKPTRLREYPLADYTYRDLLDELAFDNFSHMDHALRDNMLQFYDGFGLPPPGTRIDRCVADRWTKTWIELNRVRAAALLDEIDTVNPKARTSPVNAAISPSQSISSGYRNWTGASSVAAPSQDGRSLQVRRGNQFSLPASATR
jgi:hypothetical protein